MEKKYIFYKTTYLKDGRFYYGSHFGTENDRYRGSNKIVHSIYKKHGIEVLKRENLKFFTNKKDMFAFESRFLKFYKLDKNPMCLNFTTNGLGGDTWSHLNEDEYNNRRENMIIKSSGPNNGNYGRKFTDTHLKKMSESRIGIPIHSNDHKIKTSERLKKEWRSGERNCENLKKYQDNRKGCQLSDEHKTLISNSLKNSERYKEGRINCKEKSKIKMINKIKQFIDLQKLNHNIIDIMNIMNIKLSTYYKYNRLANETK